MFLAKLSQIDWKELNKPFNSIMIVSPFFLKPKMKFFSHEFFRDHFVALLTTDQQIGLRDYRLQGGKGFGNNIDVGADDNLLEED